MTRTFSEEERIKLLKHINSKSYDHASISKPVVNDDGMLSVRITRTITTTVTLTAEEVRQALGEENEG